MRVATRLRPFTSRPTLRHAHVVCAAKRARQNPRTPNMDFTQGLNVVDPSVAVEGCCHGELDTIYATLKQIEQSEGLRIDLLLICGDFQAVRNLDDLECMAVPNKYKNLMTFYKYYNGEAKAPYPTLFIGGNHEAINYLRELHYGGWVAPDIYFLGYSGVVHFGGVRIAGLSGIYNERHYNMGHYESLPYSDGTKRSAYHTRAFDVYKLKQIREPVDVFLSHDWPDCVTDWGNTQQLIQRKPYFKKEIREGCLGSPAGSELLNALQPRYHFAAHLHTKYPAVVDHGNGKKTRFLALDKCLPRRDFLQVVNLPFAKGPKKFSYDPEWLSILKQTMPLMCFGQRQLPLLHSLSRAGSYEEVAEKVKEKLGSLQIPENFVKTAEGHKAADYQRRRQMPMEDLRNPQIEQFLELIGIPYNLHYGGQRAQTHGSTSGANRDLDEDLIVFE